MTTQSIFNVRYITNNDIVVGICLGNTPSASHEWGVPLLAEQFGVNPSASYYRDPTESAKIHTSGSVFERLVFAKTSTSEAILAYGSDVILARVMGESEINAVMKHIAENPSDRIGSNCEKNLRTAWDNGNFVIMESPEGHGFLPTLHEAFLNEDVLMYDVNNRYGKGGLTFIISSLVSKEFVLEYLYTHK